VPEHKVKMAKKEVHLKDDIEFMEECVRKHIKSKTTNLVTVDYKNKLL
jgi:hypothetical protein